MEKIKVSELIAQALEQLGIQHVFGMIGAGNVHLFEAIARRGYTKIICIAFGYPPPVFPIILKRDNDFTTTKL